MKRFICTGLLLLLCTFMGAFAWYYSIKSEIEGNTNFKSTDAIPRVVTVPLGGTTYVDVRMDGINTELEETNQLTLWKFNDGRIVRTMNHEAGKQLTGEVMYTTNKEVYRKYGNYYVSASSEESYVDISKEGFLTNEAYEAPCPEMTEENQLKELPNVDIPTDFQTEGVWKLPKEVEKIALSQSSEDMSYYRDSWYLNYNFRYQKQADAIIDAATRVCALSHLPLEWWYMDDNLFIAKSGDEIACVKQLNYTSCYFISSNDLSYVMLNIK